MHEILHLIWAGLWTGFGVEISFFLLWAAWHLVHPKVAHKIGEESFFHKIHKYFE